jgi:single-stranded-DNA-specific exonuclease
VELAQAPAVVSRNHLKLSVRQNSREIDCIGFGMGHLANAIRGNSGRLAIAFVPTLNVWQNRARLQLKLRDVQIR